MKAEKPYSVESLDWLAHPRDSWGLDEFGRVQSDGRASPYQLNNPQIYDDMLHDFAAIDDAPAMLDPFADWLARYGLPAKDVPLEDMCSAVRSTRFLLNLLNSAMDPTNLFNAGEKLPGLSEDQKRRLEHAAEFGLDERTTKRMKMIRDHHFRVDFPSDEGVFIWIIDNEGRSDGDGGPVELSLRVYANNRHDYSDEHFRRRAARDFIINALGEILAGVHPSAEWMRDSQGSYLLQQNWTVRCPWEALNLALYHRVCDGVQSRRCDHCRNYYSMNAKRSTSKYCSERCRKARHFQNAKTTMRG
jgi:hypothetical protein